MKKEMSIMAQKGIYNDDFYLTETFIYKVESEVYEKDDCEVIDDCVDENLESKLKLLQKALENNEVIMNSLEKQLDKERKNI
ncbi:MAG: hypothetical protein MSA33_08520 [Campylobacter sp.]|uniref:hypothetical protein n=1 Tax=Campylobacter sp. TaxID=205 RepID=UPI002AA66382|nr:hypothetical protein [Campylobacter sp.]MCI7550468.1 hypothetical protein [Campylobacter sp.]